jgi:hypothetical protein
METPCEPAAPETQAELEQIAYVRSKIEKNIEGADRAGGGGNSRFNRTLPPRPRFGLEIKNLESVIGVRSVDVIRFTRDRHSSLMPG